MQTIKTGRIFLAAFAANLSAFAVGNCLGWTSPIAPKLKADNTADSPLDHKISASEDAWISSILALGALFAPFVAGPLAERIGRKWVLLSSSLFFIFASILLMVAGQVWVLLVARCLQGLGCGFVMTIIPMYVGEISTDNIRGATGSLMQLFIVAPFVAGPLAERIGRKWVLLSSSLFFIFASILLMVAEQVWVLLVARCLQGLGCGFVMTIIPMYVGEISTDNIRGATGSLMQLFIVAGILYVYTIGPYVSYQALQWFCLAVPIVFDIVFFFMPETPYYYAGKGRKKEALKSLKFLRAETSDAVKDEMSSIQTVVEESMAHKANIMDLITNLGNRRALTIAVGLEAFQQLSGINVVLFNAQSIFESAGIGLDPAVATIVVGVVQVASSALTPLIADRLGRKVILLTSASLMGLSLAALGVFFYIQLELGDTSKVLWLPVPALVMYNIMFCVGFGPLPWAIMGEMFPPNVKSAASSITTSTCWITGFLVAYSYPLLAVLGNYYAFWLYAFFCVLAVIFTRFVVMETKGLSLQEIQYQLNDRSRL